MTVNQLIERLQKLDERSRNLEVFISGEMGFEPLTEQMINNDYLLQWVKGKPVQGKEFIAIYPPV